MELHEEDFELLNAMDGDMNIRMSELDFRRLLPYVISPEESAVRTKRDMGVVIAACQGNPSRAIEVHDAQGKTLFIMPPLVARAATAVLPKEGDPQNDIGELTALYDSRIGTEPPHVVNEWYQNMLVSRSYSPEQSLFATYTQQWIQIYRYYNIPLERLLGEKAAMVPGVSTPEANKSVKDGPIEHELTEADIEDI